MYFVSVILCLALAVWLTLEVLRAWQTGVARGRVFTFARKEEAFAYWILVLVQTLAIVACCLGAVTSLRNGMRAGDTRSGLPHRIP